MLLTKEENEIFEMKKLMGNELLYNWCREKPLDWNGDEKYKSEDALAAKMWIIGRSYAASPERYSYKNLKSYLNEDKKIKLGTDENEFLPFFDNLAQKLLDPKLSEFSELIDSINTLNKKDPYTFKDGQNGDIETLGQVIYAVLLLNKLVKECRYAIDENKLKRLITDDDIEIIKINQTNSISFCSKFLHFHAPNHIFILDSITSSCLIKKIGLSLRKK